MATELIVHIDEEFRKACRALTDEEQDLLQQKLQAEQCTEEFVYTILDGRNLQLDGHHRRAICDNFSIPYFGWRHVHCESREQALEWIAAHQFGRRNQNSKESKHTEKLILGLRYLKAKKTVGRPKSEKNTPENNGTSDSENVVIFDHISGDTRQEIAEENQVSEASVKRAAKLAEKLLDSFCDRCKRFKAPACDKCRKKMLEFKDEPEPEKPEPASEPSKAEMDEEGQEIPKGLSASFQAIALFKEADSLCGQLQKLIHQISDQPGGEQLGMLLHTTGDEDKTIRKSEHLNALKRDLKGTRPHAVCKECKGKKCNVCGRRGWITKTTWRQSK